MIGCHRVGFAPSANKKSQTFAFKGSSTCVPLRRGLRERGGGRGGARSKGWVKLNPFDPQLESAWFQPLPFEPLMKRFPCYRICALHIYNLYRYDEARNVVGRCTLNQVDP
jgi:hypothetical protein